MRDNRLPLPGGLVVPDLDEIVVLPGNPASDHNLRLGLLLPHERIRRQRHVLDETQLRCREHRRLIHDELPRGDRDLVAVGVRSWYRALHRVLELVLHPLLEPGGRQAEPVGRKAGYQQHDSRQSKGAESSPSVHI